MMKTLKKYIPWQTFLLLFFGMLFFGNAPSFAADVLHTDANSSEIDSIIDDIEGETNLPRGDIGNDLIPVIIKSILGIFSVLLTVSVLWSGTIFLAQFGDDEQISKAKRLLIWSVVGVVITAISYTYVSGILNLEWDQ